MVAAFIGRQQELASLEALSKRRVASLAVITGRRRIGKSRLLEEFAKQFEQAYLFSGIAPSRATSAQTQRSEFSNQLARMCHIVGVDSTDWSHLFWHLAERTRQGRTLIVLDEITWMGDKDPSFLGKLKNIWDSELKKNDQLIMAISGSTSAWIEKNILSSTGFLGRPSLTMNLEELALRDCLVFWEDPYQHISLYEKIKLLCVTGGVPRYLEQIQSDLTAEDNIKQLCFIKDGLLVGEYDKIFNDLFDKRNQLYQTIMASLADGAADQQTIARRIGLTYSSDLAGYLNDLCVSGFISRDYTWILKKGTYSKLSQYRIKDNYSRFYLKYIKSHLINIQQNYYKDIALTELTGWYTTMGLQFENLILSNRDLFHQALNIHPGDIVCANPYFQRKTKAWAGCQIDYLIQTKLNVLYLCEIKFSKNPVAASVINSVQEKMNRLQIPRNFSCRCVLIHINGVDESVSESGFFTYIIDLHSVVGENLTD